MEDGRKTSRRGFATAIIYGLNAIIGGAMAVPALGYLLGTKTGTKRKDFIEVGDISGLVVGTPQEMTYQRVRRDGWKTVIERASTWVVKREGGDVLALHPNCTHLGCAYHWEKNKGQFDCPCHTSTFDVAGKVLGGPAPRALDRYETIVRDGRLSIGPLQPPGGEENV